jgi:DNA-binding transcriptional MerR regulator
MTVGELSRRTGVPVKALREYTDWGLIYTLGRSGANYRLYDEEALRCVQAITELLGLGLILAEIRWLASRYPDENGRLIGPRLAELAARTGWGPAGRRRGLWSRCPARSIPRRTARPCRTTVRAPARITGAVPARARAAWAGSVLFLTVMRPAGGRACFLVFRGPGSPLRTATGFEGAVTEREFFGVAQSRRGAGCRRWM